MSSKLKQLAIVGRPNVGKSTLFNVLTNTKKALVKDYEGLTRDIQVERGDWLGHEFEVIDTGGITDRESPFALQIKQQVQNLLSTVDAIIFVVDARQGLTLEDRNAFQFVRNSGKPFVIAINKVDSVKDEEVAKYDFYELSECPYSCSFEARRGVSDLLDALMPYLQAQSIKEEKYFTMAIVGKPNAGKSSLTNQLLGEEKMLVSDTAGTTTDSIGAVFQYADKTYKIVDTAGIRRRSKMQDGVEVLSSIKARESIRKADLVLLIVDGLLGPSDQDTKLLSYVVEQAKPAILVANKSDLAEKQIAEYRKSFREKMQEEFHFYSDLPIVFVSAKTSSGIKKLFMQIEEVREKMQRRISTSKLNQFFSEVTKRTPPPVYKTKNVRFLYMTQTEQVPPSFICFVNHSEGVTDSYRRYLINRLKETFDLQGIPLRIYAMRSKASLTKNKAEILAKKELEVHT
tara:strand:+ start:16704 stop:18077 length:1374 start_codon:yes stop_codon:yes gene_type:complete